MPLHTVPKDSIHYPAAAAASIAEREGERAYRGRWNSYCDTWLQTYGQVFPEKVAELIAKHS